MNDNPYRPEILGTFVFAPLVLGLETWRRWGELLSPAALDDWFVFVAAMVVSRKLARRDTMAPTLWVFVCGGAWFMFCLSLWGSIYRYDQPVRSTGPLGRCGNRRDCIQGIWRGTDQPGLVAGGASIAYRQAVRVSHGVAESTV